MVDKVGVGCEHPVREPVIAHELPDVLGGVELRAFGREHHERDVVWNHEAGREVPSGFVDDEYRLLTGSHFGGYFGEVQDSASACLLLRWLALLLRIVLAVLASRHANGTIAVLK